VSGKDGAACGGGGWGAFSASLSVSTLCVGENVKIESVVQRPGSREKTKAWVRQTDKERIYEFFRRFSQSDKTKKLGRAH
jgi:hypothetical protein